MWPKFIQEIYSSMELFKHFQAWKTYYITYLILIEIITFFFNYLNLSNLNCKSIDHICNSHEVFFKTQCPMQNQSK